MLHSAALVVISTHGGMIALCLMLQRRHQLAGEDAERAAPGIRRGAQHLQPVHVERPARVRALGLRGIDSRAVPHIHGIFL